MVCPAPALLRVVSRFLLVAIAAAAASAQDRPNVVMILSDDQAFGDYGFMGNDVIRTPNLDRLAAAGSVFPRGYVPTALCRPSLATFATGRMPHRHGVTGNDPLPGQDRGAIVRRFKNNPNLPTLLGRLGYRSFQCGKWWEGSYADGGFTAGMTHGDPARGGRHGDKGLEIGRKTMQPIYDFIAADRSKPFFLWYAPFLPHTPHNPPKRLLDKYGDAPGTATERRYYAMCEWFDETCGDLLKHLDDKGLTDDTLVVLVTDNGWIQQKSSGGFAPRSKRSPNEGGVRTPIVLKWPKRAKIAPRRIDVPVSSIDLFPTILKACGGGDLLAEVQADGVDLAPLCTAATPRRDPVFGAAFTHDIVDLADPTRSLLSRWVVDGRWKLIWPQRAGAPAELYDLGTDPHEDRDLAAGQPDRVAKCKELIQAHWKIEPARRPNFLVIVTDDQRNDMLGCAGHPILQTPNLDALAAGGVRFTNTFVTTAICAASRASIFTGLHRGTHGFTFGTPPLAQRFTDASYPTLLRSAGWRTGFVGKFGIKVERGAQRRMFDVHKPLAQPYLKKQKDGSTKHLTDIVAERAVEFLRGGTKGEPFCLSVSFHAPHAEDGNARQYIWPPSCDGLYEDARIPPPPDAGHFDQLPGFLKTSLGRIRWKWRFDSEEKRVAMTKGYYRMITGVDKAVGRILAELDSQGLRDDTVVMVMGDNGYFLGEFGLAGKWLIYEPSIRVPLIIHDPRQPKTARGVTNGEMVLNIDLAPTILEMAGIPAPAGNQGSSLATFVQGGSVFTWREDFFYEHRFDNKDIPKSEGVRGQRYVYVRYFERQPVHEELFDLQSDPRQLRNRIKDPALASVRDTMRKRCDALRGEYVR